MNYVQDGLYIGSADDACRRDVLTKNGITHILSVEHRPLSKHVTDGFQYKYIHALDMEHVDLLTHFEEGIAFIEEGRAAGGVLVHCYFGQSRSATMVLAYLMHKMALTLDDAMSLLLKHRPQIRPNPGFKEQLQLFEAMGNCIDVNNEQYKLYRLNMLALQIQSAKLSDHSHVDSFSADPCNSQGSDSGDVMYKCKKCRRPLFKSSSKLSHSEGRGEVAFDWRSQLPSVPDLDEKEEVTCEQSLFIEPVRWMGEDVLMLEGKISCPKCHAKLGSFTWTGERCPCGTWVTPAFHIQSNKVDEVKIRAVQPICNTPVPRPMQSTPPPLAPSGMATTQLPVRDAKMAADRPVAKVSPMVQSTCDQDYAE